jgi:hypothetical protein
LTIIYFFIHTHNYGLPSFYYVNQFSLFFGQENEPKQQSTIPDLELEIPTTIPSEESSNDFTITTSSYDSTSEETLVVENGEPLLNYCCSSCNCDALARYFIITHKLKIIHCN